MYSCLSYPVYKLHLFCIILHCHRWPVWLYLIFAHDLINDTDFSKNVLNLKCVF